MSSLVLIGGGGHCISCINVIEQTNEFHVEAILDQRKFYGNSILSYKINGTDIDVKEYIKTSFFLITVGQISSAKLRIQLYNFVKNQGGKFASIVSPNANVSKHSLVGEGTIIMHGSLVNANVQIGENCIINSQSNIEHDVIIGKHCHISTGAMVNGGVVIGDNCFIGSGAVLAQNIKICTNTVIGAGSVVIKSITKPGVYFGNPAKFFENI